MLRCTIATWVVGEAAEDLGGRIEPGSLHAPAPAGCRQALQQRPHLASRLTAGAGKVRWASWRWSSGWRAGVALSERCSFVAFNQGGRDVSESQLLSEEANVPTSAEYDEIAKRLREGMMVPF